jgi:hypothetical protein
MKTFLCYATTLRASSLIVTLFFADAVQSQQIALPADQREYQQIHRDATSIIVNESIDDTTFQNSGDDVYWARSFVQSNTRYVRFYFDSIASPPGTKYRFRVLRQPSEQEVESITEQEFSKESAFISGLLPPGSLRIELVADSKPKGLSFRLERVLWQAKSSEVTPQTVVIKFKFVRVLPESHPALKAAQSIAKLHIGPTETSCTGWLVRQNVVATNYHCLPYSLSFLKTEGSGAPSCHDILAEFDYLSAGQRGPTARCLSVVANKELDVALLTFPTSTQVRVPLEVRPPAEGIPKAVHLIHHPLGLPMVIEEGCALPQVENADLLHDCLSTVGSSGSPLVDDRMRLVGIHYKGAYPSSWTIRMLEEDYLYSGPRFNRAKAITSLLDILKQ